MKRQLQMDLAFKLSAYAAGPNSCLPDQFSMRQVLASRAGGPVRAAGPR